MISDISNQTWLLVAAVAIPLAMVSGYYLWVIDRRDQAVRLRIERFRGEIRQTLTNDLRWYHQLGIWLAPIIGVVEQRRLQKNLSAAGIKARGGVAAFIAIKTIVALSMAGLLWTILEVQSFEKMMILRVGAIGLGLMFGWRLPDVILSRLVARRRLSLENGIPDALDLLVICSESGLSLNQAVDEISNQMRMSNKNVADEFTITSAEMRLLPDFSQALDNLVERTGMTQLGSMVATLKQSMKYGTPLADALRMIAVEMRAERQAAMEERAARLPVLLAVPMMMFILPCLFMIVGTPLVIRMMDMFKNLHFGAR